MKTLRTRRIPALIAALAALTLTLLTAGCGGGSSSAGDLKTLRLGVIGSDNTLTGPIGFAHDRGELLPALKPLGVEKIEVTNFPNGPDLNQALVAGRLDVATYGDTPALVARGTDLQTRVLTFAQFNLNAGVVTKDSSINSLKDLAGKKVAVSKGSYIDRYLRGALEEGDIDAEVVHLLPAEQESALDTGTIDAGALPGVVPSVQYQSFLIKGFRSIDSIYQDHPDLAGSSVTVSTEDLLEKQPKLASTWKKLHADSVAYAKEHWDDYLAFEIGHSKAPEQAIREAANPESFSTEDFPAEALKLLTGTKQFLVDQGSIEKDFDLEQWLYREN